MKKLIPLLVLAGIVLVGLSWWGYANSQRNQAIDMETQLSAQFQGNQNQLSTMVSTLYETLGLADRKSAQMDKILSDAVKGRYDQGSSATPAVSGGQLVSAMREAYPNLEGLNSYDKVMTQLQGDRKDFKQVQDDLLDQLRAYDAWRAHGILRSWALGNFFPSRYLRAQVGAKLYFGKEAEEQMRQIVLAPAALDAYTTHQMAPMAMPPLPK